MRLLSGVFSLLENFTFDLFLYDCVNVRMLYKYVKKHRLIALVLNSDEKCNFSLLKLCDFKNYFLNLPL